MKLLTGFFVLVFVTKLCFSAEKNPNNFLDFGDKQFSKEKISKSKWVFGLGFEFLEFTTDFEEYNGEFESVGTEKFSSYGLNVGLGREFYFGKGISSTISFNGFYLTSGKTEIGNAAKDIDLELANVRRTANFYGGEASLSLNYLIDNKVIDVQPFIQVAAGTGIIDAEISYKNYGIADGKTNEENYDMRVKENFTHTKLSLGMNIIAFNGLTSYFKINAIGLIKTQKDLKGSIKPLGSTTVASLDSSEDGLSEVDSIVSASLGLGYLF